MPRKKKGEKKCAGDISRRFSVKSESTSKCINACECVMNFVCICEKERERKKERKRNKSSNYYESNSSIFIRINFNLQLKENSSPQLYKNKKDE